MDNKLFIDHYNKYKNMSSRELVDNYIAFRYDEKNNDMMIKLAKNIKTLKNLFNTDYFEYQDKLLEFCILLSLTYSNFNRDCYKDLCNDKLFGGFYGLYFDLCANMRIPYANTNQIDSQEHKDFISLMIILNILGSDKDFSIKNLCEYVKYSSAYWRYSVYEREDDKKILYSFALSHYSDVISNIYYRLEELFPDNSSYYKAQLMELKLYK